MKLQGRRKKNNKKKKKKKNRTFGLAETQVFFYA